MFIYFFEILSLHSYSYISTISNEYKKFFTKIIKSFTKKDLELTIVLSAFSSTYL